MQKWIVIVIVCLIYSFVMTPIERRIYRRIKKKWLAYIVTFLIALAILFALYCIADLCGFGYILK